MRVQRGLGDVRTSFEDARDHARTRGAGAHLEEYAHAVFVRALDEAWEVEALHRLFEDAARRVLRRDLVGLRLGGAVETHVLRRRGREEVEVVVGPCDRHRHGAVDGRHAVERVEAAAQGLHDGAHALSIAADHALGRRVDDQQIDALFGVEHASHGGRRAIDDADHPIHVFVVGQPPGLAHALAASRQIIGEEGALHQPGEHLLTVAPRAHREQTCGLSQAVADHAVRLHAEGPHEVAHDGAQGDLRDDEGAVVVADLARGGGGPEAVREQLLRQVEVLGVLAPGHLGPLHGRARDPCPCSGCPSRERRRPTRRVAPAGGGRRARGSSADRLRRPPPHERPRGRRPPVRATPRASARRGRCRAPRADRVGSGGTSRARAARWAPPRDGRCGPGPSGPVRGPARPRRRPRRALPRGAPRGCRRSSRVAALFPASCSSSTTCPQPPSTPTALTPCAARSVCPVAQPILGLRGQQEVLGGQVLAHGAQVAHWRQHLLVETGALPS